MTLESAFAILPGLFWLLLIAAVISAGMALARRTPGWFFATAFLFWIASSLAAWSIGWLIFALTFIFLALGVAAMFRWESLWQMALAAMVGILLWGVVISWFSEYLWLFWPGLWLL